MNDRVPAAVSRPSSEAPSAAGHDHSRSWAAVLGSPISHSLSPVLHRTAYAVLGLDWAYERIELDAAQFGRNFDRFRADPSWRGFSVTMPLKEAALAAADSRSTTARLTRAANTLIPTADCGVVADNTDPEGICWALRSVAAEQLAGVAQLAIIGTGATARSALAATAQLGITRVDVVGRREAALEEIAQVGHDFGVAVTGVEWREGRSVLDRPIVISTVPRGIADEFSDGVGGSGAIGRSGVLLDVVYSPWPTSLAAAWQESGGTVVSGLHMLVGQAGRQVTLMTGQPAPLDQMLDAGLRSLRSAN